MAQSSWLLLLAGASVAFVHAVLPDHWLPIALVARAERWSLGRTIRVSLWTSLGHVVGSLALGILFIVIGKGLHGIVQNERGFMGGVLILTGIGYGLWDGLKKTDPHPHDHVHPHPPTSPVDKPFSQGLLSPPLETAPSTRNTRVSSMLIPLGIVASPDTTIFPVLLATSAVGVALTVQVLWLYALTTVASMVGLTVGATIGGFQVQWPWLERHAQRVTAIVLILLGTAVVIAV